MYCRDNTREHPFNLHGGIKMVKGSKRVLWDDLLIRDTFANSIKVNLDDEVKRSLDISIAKAGEFYIDHSMTCKKDAHSSRKVLVVCKKDGYRAYRSLSDIGKGKYECYCCVVRKLKEKLSLKGYSLEDYLPDSKYSKIACNSCGHVKECRKAAILGRNNIDCESCRTLLYKERCASKNREYISHSRVPGGIRVVSKCNVCGDCSGLFSSSVLSGRKSISCEACLINKYKESVSCSRFYFVKFVGEISCIVACRVHNTEKKVSRKAALGGLKQIYCEDCKRDAFITALAIKGCKLIDFTSNSVNYIARDGTEFSRPTTAVLSGKFPTNSAHRRNQPFKVYMMVVEFFSNKFVKIGIAVNPQNRRKELNIALKVDIIELLSCHNHSDAIRVEKELMRRFKSYHLPKAIPESFCAGYIKKKEAVDGVTEWFDAEILTANFYEVLNDICSNP